MCCMMIAAMLPVAAFAEDTGVAIDETNFPDANFRKVASRCDTDGDGVLSDAEIGNVTEINCYDKNISNLKGIEYFTALTELYCGSNRLTALDVSSNTALTYLSCDDNKYTISPADDGTFDLSTLPGSFDMSKASDLVGGTVKGNILKVDNGVSKVTYKYDCGRGMTETFTLVLAQISGDVNGDGILDAKDLLYMRRYVADIEVGIKMDMTAADMDGDGEVTPADCLLLRKTLAGVIDVKAIDKRV